MPGIRFRRLKENISSCSSSEVVRSTGAGRQLEVTHVLSNPRWSARRILTVEAPFLQDHCCDLGTVWQLEVWGGMSGGILSISMAVVAFLGLPDDSSACRSGLTWRLVGPDLSN